MTVIDERRRPSPRPRISTEGDAAHRSAAPTPAPAERETPAEQPSTLQSAITLGSRLWERSRTYWTLPPLLSAQPPTAETLTEYARHAAYTGKTGPVRAAGILWCYGAAIPALVASRLWAWTWERPGRFIAVAVTVKLLSFLSPAAWAVDHLITPATHAVLWLFV